MAGRLCNIKHGRPREFHDDGAAADMSGLGEIVLRSWPDMRRISAWRFRPNVVVKPRGLGCPNNNLFFTLQNQDSPNHVGLNVQLGWKSPALTCCAVTPMGVRGLRRPFHRVPIGQLCRLVGTGRSEWRPTGNNWLFLSEFSGVTALGRPGLLARNIVANFAAHPRRVHIIGRSVLLMTAAKPQAPVRSATRDTHPRSRASSAGSSEMWIAV